MTESNQVSGRKEVLAEDLQEARGGLRGAQGPQGCWARGGTGGPKAGDFQGEVGRLEQGSRGPRPPQGELAVMHGEPKRGTQRGWASAGAVAAAGTERKLRLRSERLGGGSTATLGQAAAGGRGTDGGPAPPSWGPAGPDDSGNTHREVLSRPRANLTFRRGSPGPCEPQPWSLAPRVFEALTIWWRWQVSRGRGPAWPCCPCKGRGRPGLGWLQKQRTGHPQTPLLPSLGNRPNPVLWTLNKQLPCDRRDRGATICSQKTRCLSSDVMEPAVEGFCTTGGLVPTEHTAWLSHPGQAFIQAVRRPGEPFASHCPHLPLPLRYRLALRILQTGEEPLFCTLSPPRHTNAHL